MRVLLTILLVICSTSLASAQSCVVADPLRLFCEDWSTYTPTLLTPPGAPWSWNGAGQPGANPNQGNVTVVAGGLGGDSKSLKIVDQPINNSGWIGDCGGCAGGDAPVSGANSTGTTYWVEFNVKFSAGYRFGVPDSNYDNKNFAILGSGASQRILVDFRGQDNLSPNPTTALPRVVMYPNTATGGTDPGGNTNNAFDKGPNLAQFAVTGGIDYHCVLAVTVGNGITGSYRFWINDVQTHAYSGLQTSSTAGVWTWNGVAIGGPKSGPLAGGGQFSTTGKVRITNTSLLPVNPSVPVPGLMVR